MAEGQTRATSLTQSRREEELVDMELKSKIIVSWMEGWLKEKLPNKPLREALLDGVLLCRLANEMKPGSVKRYHKHPKMLMMKMENIAFFCAAAKARWSVPATALFTPTDVHDDTDPAAMLKVIRVLLLIRQDSPGDAVIDESLLQALNEGENSSTTTAAEPAVVPVEEVEPEPPVEDDEDDELKQAEEAANAAANAAQEAMNAARLAKERAVERVATQKAAAEKLAAEKAAEKAAADKLIVDKAAAEKVAALQKQASASAIKTTPASSNGASSSHTDAQASLLSSILNCVHSELTVDSKTKLFFTLDAHLKAVENKVMVSSDKELQALCAEMGLSPVPANKDRKFYVDFILKQGRVTSS